jgi:hypothetical protein
MGKNHLTEMEVLRASAGIRTNLDTSKTSKLKTLDIESDVLRSFSCILRDFSRMKQSIKGAVEGPHNNPYNRAPLKMEMGEANKKRLYVVAMKKIELLKEAIEDCFGEERENNDD